MLANGLATPERDEVGTKSLRSSDGVSVIVCTNRPGQLSDAVASILAIEAPEFELVVVAQGGDWALADLAPFRSDPRLRVILDPGKGLSRARNLGLEASTGNFILFTDDDCTVAPDWIEQHLRAHAEHPEVELLFGRVDPPASYTPDQGIVPTFDPATADRARMRGGVVLGMGANMRLLRSAVDRVGTFDEQLGAGAAFPSCEDLDYSLRLVAAGGCVAADDRPSVVHEGGVRAHGSEDRLLWRRDGIGMGALTAKCVRRADWHGASVVTGFVAAIGGGAIKRLARRRSPSGARMAGLITLGALEGAVRQLNARE